MLILDLLLNAHAPKPFLIGKILGCFFLMLGGSMGIFFLFQGLIPLVGPLESGMIVSAVTTLVGLTLLFTRQKKKASPPEEIAEKALTFFKGLEIEKVLKDNAFALSLLALGVGIGLSQLGGLKKLTEAYKVFK